ncbi:MAG: flagellar basal body P-ring formation chaperone FlgA, partial [Synergistaceae bacterium]|nr:flagellar basal body P-ring formation chaperone FlgA [Synergistaceae bacterium]
MLFFAGSLQAAERQTTENPEVSEVAIEAAIEVSIEVSIPPVVQLPEQACVLSDIAVFGGPPELTERIGRLLLSVENGVISREQVVNALKVSGLEGVRVVLKMPRVVAVEPPEGSSDGNMQAGNAQAKNAQASPTERGREDLQELVKSLAAWTGDVQVQYRGAVPEGRLVSPASLVPGTSLATLRFQDAAGRERSLAVRLVWTQPALVLARSVKKGEVLKESDFVVRQIRVSRAGVYASRASEVAGRALKKNIAQGETIPLNSVADVPIINRGKIVTIVAQNAGLRVEARGEALEDGALGDSIRVRN